LRTRGEFGKFEDVQKKFVGIDDNIPNKASKNFSSLLVRKSIQTFRKSCRFRKTISES